MNSPAAGQPDQEYCPQQEAGECPYKSEMCGCQESKPLPRKRVEGFPLGGGDCSSSQEAEIPHETAVDPVQEKSPGVQTHPLHWPCTGEQRDQAVVVGRVGEGGVAHFVTVDFVGEILEGRLLPLLRHHCGMWTRPRLGSPED